MFYDDPSAHKSFLIEELQDLVEVTALDRVINIEMNALLADIKQAVNNKSISHSDETGVARWEKILGVTAPLNSTLKARKEALKARLMTKPPINLVTAKEIIQAYMGLEVDVFVSDFTLTVKYRGQSRVSDLTPLYATLYDIIPANLIIDISYLFLTWDELDSLNITFDSLDAKTLTWDQFERGDWVE